jgi:rSAM/selenodomain-associated transferase 1
MKKYLIAYAKKPLPGYAKTRLGSELGFEESAGVYARFLYTCLLEMVGLVDDDLTIELSLASETDLAFFTAAFPEFIIKKQVGLDLGQRFFQSFKEAFESDAHSVVVIGTDIPGLDQSIIQSAFKALDKKDVVIGPDTDGGYYLIGTRNKHAVLFHNIEWSTWVTLQQTKDLIKSQNLSLKLLPVLSDIDTKTDFQRWLAERIIS